MQGLNSREIFVKLNFSRFFTFFKMTLDFIPRQSRLVFKSNRVTLVVFGKENTIIMTCYEFIVTFYFGGNGFHWCTTPEKGVSPYHPRIV